MKSLSLNFKISMLLVFFAFGSAVIAYLGLKETRAINEQLNFITDKKVFVLNKSHELKELLYIQLLNEKNIVLSPEMEVMQRYETLLNERDKQIKDVYNQAVEVATEDNKKFFQDFMSEYAKWWDLAQKIKQLSFERKDEEAGNLSRNNARAMRLSMEKQADGAIHNINEELAKISKETDIMYDNSKLLLLLLSLSIIALGSVVAFFIMKALTTAIDKVIDTLSNNSFQVSSAAGQIASSSEELSQASSEQASSLEETAASIEEMSSMIQKNSENASRSSDLAGKSNRNATKGQEIVGEMVRSIGDISASNTEVLREVEESNKKIADIVNVINEIGNKTRVINDIVFQTKLLSFNASVEAARAGEHGKGFAVVAEEVGSLAQMSGNAAKEISDMLESSIQKVEAIVAESKQKVGGIITHSKTKIEHGTQIANECGIVLREIVENISLVNQMASDISIASQEQSQGIQEITRAMNILDEVTQTNASTSEETASAAEQLSTQAETLKATVDLLFKTIKGENSQLKTQSSSSTSNAKKSREKMKNNVVSFKQPAKKTTSAAPLRKAVGHDHIPTEDDPRFEEI